MTYQHRVPSITFESNKFNLGHYLRDNSQEIFFSLGCHPYKQLSLAASYTLAQHGNDYYYTDGYIAERFPFMKDKTWQNQSADFRADYEFALNTHIFVEYAVSNTSGYATDGLTALHYLEKYTEPLYRGTTNTVAFGLNIGF